MLPLRFAAKGLQIGLGLKDIGVLHLGCGKNSVLLFSRPPPIGPLYVLFTRVLVLFFDAKLLASEC